MRRSVGRGAAFPFKYPVGTCNKWWGIRSSWAFGCRTMEILGILEKVVVHVWLLFFHSIKLVIIFRKEKIKITTYDFLSTATIACSVVILPHGYLHLMGIYILIHFIGLIIFCGFASI